MQEASEILEDLINEMKNQNLCTHFVLPLLKLSKFSFISANVVNTFLTRDAQYIVVQIVDENLLSRQVTHHTEYRGIRKHGDRTFLLYLIPVKWRTDVHLFMAGKYSQMSQAAKDSIIRHSRLPYREKRGDQVIVDGRLLALERHPYLKQMWEERIASSQIPKELLSIPGKESYIDLTTFIVEQPETSSTYE